jgi:D-ornithine---citrate ligase
VTSIKKRPAGISTNAAGEQSPSPKPDQLAHAKAMQFLRLVVSALAEGLAGDLKTIEIVMSNGERRELPCRHAEVLGFLYTNALASIRSVSLYEAGRQRVYRDAEDFLENYVKQAIRVELGAQFSEATWTEFREEMADSVVNEARALGAQSRLQTQLAGLMSTRGARSLFGYLTGLPEIAQDLAGIGHDTPSLLMQIGSFSGHHTHPCAKTRLLPDGGIGPVRRPLSMAEFDAYAPEAAADVALPILAARNDRVTTSLSRALAADYTGYFATQFPDAHRRWANSLAVIAGEAAPHEFAPIPVHPLQLDAIRTRLAGPIAEGDILFPAGATITQRPTISFRTLMPVHRPHEPQIKTTLAMLMTNDVRTVSPARSFNAPLLSDLLLDIAAADPLLRDKFRPLPETAAITWGRDADSSSQDYKDGFHLGVTIRANSASVLSVGEISIPLNTLLSASARESRAMLLTELMAESGARNLADVLTWFRRYADTVLPAIFGLLAGYGVGLEAHQQNTDVIFDSSGEPRTLAYRDVSDLEICEPMLVARGFDIRSTLHPFIRNLFDDIDRPLRQTMHTTMVSHLFPVVDIIAEAFALPTASLYAIIRDSIVAALGNARRSLVEQHGSTSTAALLQDRLTTIERRILHEPIETKRVLHKRLTPLQDVSFTTIDNPLARL